MRFNAASSRLTEALAAPSACRSRVYFTIRSVVMALAFVPSNTGFKCASAICTRGSERRWFVV
jgi:hypothetical protein